MDGVMIGASQSIDWIDLYFMEVVEAILLDPFNGSIDKKIDGSINQLIAQSIDLLIDSLLVDKRGWGMRWNNWLTVILGK